MAVYWVRVVCVYAAVSGLLLSAADRLCGFSADAGRALRGALAGGCCAAACLVPGFGFLGNPLWRLVSLGLTGWAAFGWGRGSALRCGAFMLLSLALEGMTQGARAGCEWALPLAAVGVWMLCGASRRNRTLVRQYVPVRLRYGERSMQVLALQDTGNTLRDPVSGEPVLVLSAGAAQRLTGLTGEQLRAPVETVASGILPGLRLLPYRAVGGGGLLPALRLDEVWINGKPAARLAAFAPEGLDGKGMFQALTGGML